MSALAVQQLTIGYAGRALARDITFTLAPSEAVAILGQNGSGKTTLFRTLLGLLAPLAGVAKLHHKPVAEWLPAALAREIAYVPQAGTAQSGLRVIDVVEMARAAHLAWYAQPQQKDREIALAALDEMNLAEFAERNFDELSGGEKQLVLIARALAAESPIILMDEPTANLDFGNQYLLLDEIAKLKARGKSIIFTTHAPDHALRIADRTLMLMPGGRVALGITQEVVTAPALTALYDVPVQLVPYGSGVVTTVSRVTTQT